MLPAHTTLFVPTLNLAQRACCHTYTIAPMLQDPTGTLLVPRPAGSTAEASSTPMESSAPIRIAQRAHIQLLRLLLHRSCDAASAQPWSPGINVTPPAFFLLHVLEPYSYIS